MLSGPTRRTDVSAASRIPSASLLFIDDVELAALHGRGQLALTLVDHNQLASRQADLAPAVVAVLDHHADGGGHQAAAPRIIETVGSATTLVFEYHRDAG